MRIRWFGIGVLLVACVGGTFVFGQVQGGFFAWFLFAFVLVLSLYEMVTGVVGLRGVISTRKFSATRLSAGQMLQIHVDIERTGWWPLFWLRVQDELPPRFEFDVQGGERVLLPLWAKQLNYSYRISGLQRGVYRIGDTILETGDMLGILSLKRQYQRSDVVTVYPRVVPIRGWAGVQPEELGLHEATRRRSDESTTVLGVRDYVPGDRLSRIHWRATARRGTLLAKEFEMYVSSELVFVPDLSQETYRGLDGHVFELVMTTVASLIKFAYERRRKFGMLLVGGAPRRLAAGMDEALFLHCMEELAMASPDAPQRFPEILQRAAQEAPMGSMLVVVSPHLTRAATVAAEQIRHRTQVEWFAPLAQNELTQEQRVSLQALHSMRIPSYAIRTAEQLSTLKRGGSPRASNLQ